MEYEVIYIMITPLTKKVIKVAYCIGLTDVMCLPSFLGVYGGTDSVLYFNSHLAL